MSREDIPFRARRAAASTRAGGGLNPYWTYVLC